MAAIITQFRQVQQLSTYLNCGITGDYLHCYQVGKFVKYVGTHVHMYTSTHAHMYAGYVGTHLHMYVGTNVHMYTCM